MLRTITPAEMKRVETQAMEQGLCTGEALMGRAAAAVARRAAHYRAARGGSVICLCGVGNNGGDGLAAMRMLAADECLQGCCLLLDGKLSADAQRELNRLVAERPNLPVRRLMNDEEYAKTGVLTDAEGNKISLEGAGCIIDALFGTGLSRPLSGVAAALCRLANQAASQGVAVLAVDIPSGLCGTSGKALGDAVCATETVTFHRPKPGLYLGEGANLTGRITVASIGLAPEWDDAPGMEVAEPEDVAQLLPVRKPYSHKGDHGRVMLLCGSFGMAGAAAIAATAALRAGAGLVTIACPEQIVNTVQTLCPCATCLPLPTDAKAALSRLTEAMQGADAFGMGCGMGTGLWARQMVIGSAAWLSGHGLPAVVDADALNLLAQEECQDLSGCIFTPHPGETARLLDVSVGEIAREPVDAARRLHEKWGASVVLKGAASVLLSRDGIGLNVLGTPAMAKGGSGDALTGVLCALLAGNQRADHKRTMLEVMQAGCGLHGLAGRMAAKRYGLRGMLATDLCECLGLAAQPEEEGSTNAASRDDALAAAYPTEIDPGNIAQSAERTGTSPLGRMVTVTVDRPLGTRHPEHKDIVYTLNYGYVQDVLADDNEWQDAYIYGESQPLELFEGQVAAVIRRLNDVEDKWVVAAPGVRLTPEQVREATAFVEKYFECQIECW
ncbi:MAG: NAD(P)H-hydrate dehydratase [Clostridiales bacterium]|nr:NAD(P)H-hydrate dehydratase [Clostridiales bacterium]